MLLAIDPGESSGWAVFDDCLRLVACGLGQPPAQRAPFVRVIVERPKIYPKGKTKNPNDVLTLALNAGEWAGEYRALSRTTSVEYVTPQDWKGQTPKEIQHARDYDKLSPEERHVVAKGGKGIAPSKRHNMLDAVGIGLFAVGRS